MWDSVDWRVKMKRKNIEWFLKVYLLLLIVISLIVIPTEASASTISNSQLSIFTLSIPNPPSGITATDGTLVDRIKITWNLINNAAYYEVYRNIINSTIGAERVGSSTSEKYSDFYADPNILFFYYIKACNSDGCSGFSSSNAGYRALATATKMIVPSKTKTPTKTLGPTKTKTLTKTPAPSKTRTPTKTIVPSKTKTPTKTIAPSKTKTPTKTLTPTKTYTPTPTNTATFTPTPSWISTGSMNFVRNSFASSILDDGSILITGGTSGDLGSNTRASSEIYDPRTGIFSITGSMNTGRFYHSSTLLSDGRVLVAGGGGASGVLASAELYDPSTGTWELTGEMNSPRKFHTATLLPNGKVLVTGGCNGVFCDGIASLNSSEEYDPQTGTWSYTALPMNSARAFHTATLLQNGKVLVTGGLRSTQITGQPVSDSTTNTAELYDPATRTWSFVASMANDRSNHSATILNDGKVLISGGQHRFYTEVGGRNYKMYPIAGAEVFDPSTNTWQSVGDLGSARSEHIDVLLPNGMVLVAGGRQYFDEFVVYWSETTLDSAEIFNPITKMWSPLPSLKSKRTSANGIMLENGNVLVVGGAVYSYPYFNGLNSAELFISGLSITPTPRPTKTITPTPTITFTPTPSYTATFTPTSTLPKTPQSTETNTSGPIPGNFSKIDPSQGTIAELGFVSLSWSSSNNVNYYEYCLDMTDDSHCSTWVNTGNQTSVTVNSLAQNSTYYWHVRANNQYGNKYADGSDSAYGVFVTKPSPVYSEHFTSTSTMNSARWFQSSVTLRNGKVLIAGGIGSSGYIASSELYDPVKKTWGITGSMLTPRNMISMTLLNDGRILVAGGFNGTTLASAEIYDPVTGTWSETGSMINPRFNHTATLLPNGKVMVAGGETESNVLTSVEIYNPVTGNWTVVGDMGIARTNHTETLMPNGKVLIAGGSDGAGWLSSAEIFDPDNNSWSSIPPMLTSHCFHSAVLLTNGKVLIAGAPDYGDAEIYDPLSNTWVMTGSMDQVRRNFSMVLLPNGKVLATGGSIWGVISGTTSSTEVFDLSSNTWSEGANLNYEQGSGTATLLLNGEVLVSGGDDYNHSNAADIYTINP